MTRQCGDHEKLRDYNSEEEEEEALSLCDLPIKVINDENQQIKNKSLSLEVEDFEFGSLGTSLFTDSEICVADDVFFQGQILPLRLSVSSENGLLLGNRLDSRNPSRSGSISESMDRSSSGNYTSRSSSSKSHHSSSTTTTTSTTTYKPLKNIFHSHPSPKPQIWNSSSKPRIVRGNRTGKSTTWGLLRVGLVKTPEIELQDLKNRNYRSFNGSFNSSTSSSNSSNNGKSKKNKNEEKIEKKKKKKMERKFIFESCKCSVDAVHETVSSKIVVIKSGISKKISINSNSSISSSGRELLIKKEVKAELESEKGKQKDLNHIRTFEWLKELSISDVPEEA